MEEKRDFHDRNIDAGDRIGIGVKENDKVDIGKERSVAVESDRNGSHLATTIKLLTKEKRGIDDGIGEWCKLEQGGECTGKK